MCLRPPITYYGGKQKMIKDLLPLIPKHRLYIEPFMGGGALFFAKEPSEAEIINDLNGNVVNFYRVAQKQFTELKKLVDGTLHSRAIHTEAKKIYNHPAEYDEIQRAWSFWVMTNQGFGGKIGTWALSRDGKVGKTLAGKRDGFVKGYADRLKFVQIESKDALDIIKHYDTPDAYIYLDPPYFNSDCGHYKGYTETDYKKLLDTLVKLKGKFLLSSYPSEILSEYVKKQGWNYKEIKKRVSVTKNSKKQKTEVLVWNYEVEPKESKSVALPKPLKRRKTEKAKSKPIIANECQPMHNPAEKSKCAGYKKVPVGVQNSGVNCLHIAKGSRNFETETEGKQLNLAHCKKVLEQSGKSYTDEEVIKIRQLLYKIGFLDYQLFTEKQKNNGKHNSLRTGKHRRTGSQRDEYPLPKRAA